MFSKLSMNFSTKQENKLSEEDRGPSKNPPPRKIIGVARKTEPHSKNRLSKVREKMTFSGPKALAATAPDFARFLRETVFSEYRTQRTCLTPHSQSKRRSVSTIFQCQQQVPTQVSHKFQKCHTSVPKYRQVPQVSISVSKSQVPQQLPLKSPFLSNTSLSTLGPSTTTSLGPLLCLRPGSVSSPVVLPLGARD